MLHRETKTIGLPPSAEDIPAGPETAAPQIILGVENQRLGFFTMPVELSDGHVLKSYKGNLNTSQAAGLDALHTAFVADLRSIGIRIPKTELRFSGQDPKLHAEIVQEKFEPQHLTRAIIRWGERELAMRAAFAVVDDALKYLTSGLGDRRGFHPTFRNYAFREDTAYLIDTFPPFASREEARELMIRHAPGLTFKLLMRIGGNFIRLYTAEYYEASPMLGGLVASMHRQRPELAHEFQRGLLERAEAVNLPERQQLEADLKAQPVSLLRFRLAELLNIGRKR